MSFHHDLARASGEAEACRAELTATLSRLRPEDLECSRRGGWPVRRVLEHLIEAEYGYGRMVQVLRGNRRAARADPVHPSASPGDLMSAVNASRASLLAALKDVPEELFYRLRRVGREEYSILSVLENVAHHDREHTEQIQDILGGAVTTQ